MAPKMSTTAKTSPGTFVLGTTHFDKISAVEGLTPTPAMLKTFQEMDQRGLSAEERVRHLKLKFGRAPAAR